MRRRDFLRNTVIGTTGVALASSIGFLTSCKGKGPNEKIIMGLIGAGNRGTTIAKGICKVDSNIIFKYICDVNDLKGQRFSEMINKEFGFSSTHVRNMKEVFDDKDIDAVIIATPDHWHALATVWACDAGKDVYLEANPSLNIWEGRQLVQAAKRYKRIVQVGFQNRSAVSSSSAREFIKMGNLGQIVHVKIYNMSGSSKWMPVPDTESPQGLDWDMWLGPAPKRPYNPGINDMENKGGWNNYWAYSGGSLSGKTSHTLDLARMIIGNPGHPSSVYSCGGNWIWDSEREVPEIQEVTYKYDKFTMTCESANGTSYIKPYVSSQQNFPDWMRVSNRIEIYGTKGLMYVGSNGGGWQVIGALDKIIAEEHDINPDELHFRKFVNSLRKGEKSLDDIEQGHLSASLVHLGNIATRVGNKQLTFDPIKEVFTNNDDANNLVKNTYREGFIIPDKI